MRARLYVDESGDHTYKNLEDASRRYLSLTGIAIEADYYRSEFQPQLEALKQTHFPHSPDEPLILHREDILNRRGAFGRLADPEQNAKWERDFVDFVAKAKFSLFTVVLDKKNHKERYGDSAMHPYHLCLTFLLERYRGYLKYVRGKGDVLAEARGGNEDLALKEVYQEIWDRGTYYISAQEFQKVLTTRELKVKRKEHNIAGLQLADLIAHPSKVGILVADRRMPKPVSSFSTKLVETLGEKYDLMGKKLFA